MDAELRVYERALLRSGRDPREVALAILREAEPRFWLLTDEPLTLGSSSCLTFFGPGSPTFDRNYTWRTPIYTIEDLADRLEGSEQFAIFRPERSYAIGDGAPVMTEGRVIGNDEHVTIESGWRGFDLAVRCFCSSCCSSCVPQDEQPIQRVLERAFGSYLPSERDRGVSDPGGGIEGRGAIGLAPGASEFGQSDVVEIPEELREIEDLERRRHGTPPLSPGR